MTTQIQSAVIIDLINGLSKKQEGLSYDKTHHRKLKSRLKGKAKRFNALLSAKEELMQNLRSQYKDLSV